MGTRKTKSAPQVKTGRNYAVLSGDIIGSSSLQRSDRRDLPDKLGAIGVAVQLAFGSALPWPLSIFSGDGWQLLVDEPHLALRVGLFVRASLRALDLEIDSRVAIAIGTVDFVPENDVAQGDGEAFRLSGRLLGELDECSMRFRAGRRRKPAELPWDTVATLLDTIIVAHWTPPRARAVTGALRGWPQADIAALWDPPIQQASISENLSKAFWPVVSRAVLAFEMAWNPT